jgi:hypothetical protein
MVNVFSDLLPHQDLGSDPSNSSLDQQNMSTTQPSPPSTFFSPPSNAAGNLGPHQTDLNDTVSSAPDQSRLFLSPATTAQLPAQAIAPTPSVTTAFGTTGTLTLSTSNQLDLTNIIFNL